MKKSRYTDEQIAFALRQAETGTPVQEVIRKMGISEADFLQLEEAVTAVLGPSEVRRLKQLEEENRRLKQMVADLSWINTCCRTCSQENSEACSQAHPGELS